ncbi:MAG: hypothetical protein ACYTBP_01620 [Planctomycetota bacterium]|jgi:hypothetical protein
METKWLKGALFAGMTSNAFKLGTVLSVGWFWMRPAGCSVLYRGPSIDQIEFGDILTVTDINSEQIEVPSWLSHESDTTYYYVVRRANLCGVEEQSLKAAAKVIFDEDGELFEPGPNSVFDIRIRRIESDKVELVWFYCPLWQLEEPSCFKVYSNSGSGQIDYDTAAAEVDYVGRRFYSYVTEQLDAGVYLFAVRAEDEQGTQDGSSAVISIQFGSSDEVCFEVLEMKIL